MRRLVGLGCAGVLAAVCVPSAATGRVPAGLAARAARVGAAARAARVGAAGRPQQLSLVFPLTADEAALTRFARAVSTPGSPRYGHYESIAKLSERFGASPRTRGLVVAYLRRAGARQVKIDATGLFADASLSAARAEQLFSTQLHRVRTGRYGFIAPATAVVVPRALRGLVGGVIGLDTQPLASPGVLRADARTDQRIRTALQAQSGYFPATGTPGGCSPAQATKGFTPAQYLTAYDYGPLYSAGISGQGERVALIEIDGFRKSDIAAFATCFGLHLPPVGAFGVSVSKPFVPGGEATLDIEALAAAAPGLRSIDVYESQPDPADTLKALTAPLQNTGYKPQVISASLGLCEADTDAAVGRAGILASEGALAEAAASGITFLASSGDSGSADCVTSDGVPEDYLSVNYPASSPWVTAVGGTNLSLTPANTLSNQVVWNDGSLEPGAAGGGGSSTLFKRPSWQSGIVASGARTLPDVSMLADIAPGYAVYCTANPDCVNTTVRDPWQTVGGTSAATPLLAGGLALVDEDLRLHDRQDLGFVDPLLYTLGRNPAAAAAAFSDVTAIGNDVGPFIAGNGLPLGCCTAGPGYDEASGWGSVNVAALAALALGAQPPVVGVALSLPGRQTPIARRQILATVSCSRPCLMRAVAAVTIGRSRPFTAYSRAYGLRTQAAKTVAIPFSPHQVSELRAGRWRRERIVAQVFALIVDPAGNVERKSRASALTVVDGRRK